MSNVTMIALGQRNLDVYFAVLVIVALVTTLLYTYFSPKTRKALNSIGVAFVAGFLVIVALKIIDILYRT